MQCGNCGAANPDGARFCGQCGMPITAPTEPVAAKYTAVEGHRPLYLVAVLSVITVGLYAPFWLGMTWSEMKRELRRDTMYPMWHGLTMFVPIYAYFRVHAHFRAINELLSRSGSDSMVNPGAAVLALIVGNFLGGLSNLASGAQLALLVAMSSLVIAAVMVHGQRGLNAYWKSLPGGAT